MNREILFRGKRLDNGEWVEGCLLIGFTGIHYIITLRDHILGITEMYEVDPSTVGQYTGLTDKNGVRIFEGDIVTGKFEGEKITGQIVYGSDAMFFIDRNGLYGICLNSASDWLTVTGTIYDEKDDQHDKP